MRRAFRSITHLDYRSGANLLCGGGKRGEIYALIVVSSVVADSRTGELTGQQVFSRPHSFFISCL